MTEIIDIVEPYITGPQGAGGTIESATAVGLAPGADPTVTLGGTPEQRTIEFGIPEGEPGTPATITSATAETLPPQSAATVTVGGTPSARTFTFGIPKGDPGSGSVNSVNGDLGPDVILGPSDVGGSGSATPGTMPIRGAGGVLPGVASPTAQTHGANKKYVDDAKLEALAGATSMVAHSMGQVPPSVSMSRMEVVSMFPVRESGETSWPQGFDINYADNEVYVSNIKGTELRIDIRDLTTGNRKSSKTFTVAGGGWTESLSWFKNSSDQLCFIVWPTAPATNAKASHYAIANYASGTLSAHTPINGKWRGCRDGDYFVTGWVDPNAAYQFYIYTWNSIVERAPVLIDTVTISNPGPTNGKIQGLASVMGDLFLFHGEQNGVPGLTSYDPNGNLVRDETWRLDEFARLVNHFRPGTLTQASYLYEAEGATQQGGKLHTLHIVNNTPGTASAGKVVIVAHGTTNGIDLQAAPGRLANSDWVEVPASMLATGWALTSSKLKVRVRNGQVEWAGAVVNASFTGGFTPFLTLTGDLLKYKPAETGIWQAGGNTPTARSIEASLTGALRVWQQTTTGAWLYLSMLRYPII